MYKAEAARRQGGAAARRGGVPLAMATAAALALALALALAPPASGTEPPEHGPANHFGSTLNSASGEQVIIVSGVPFESGAAVVTRVAVAALEAGGTAAAVGTAPRECASPYAPDSEACLNATLHALVQGAVQAALVPVPASRPPHPLLLRDAGLEDLGDAAPPARRACYVKNGTLPPLRTLLTLADASSAAAYHVPHDKIEAALKILGAEPAFRLGYRCPLHLESDNCMNIKETWQERPAPDSALATLLTGDAAEARVLAQTACQWRLRVCILALGAHLRPVTAALSAAPTIACDRALQAPGDLLASPPCAGFECPFEARRILKLVNARRLANSPSAFRSLARFSLNEKELHELTIQSRIVGPEDAARQSAARHPEWRGSRAEVRVAVMVPATTRRHAYDAVGLRAAAEVAERDMRDEGLLHEANVNTGIGLDFKAELLDDGCAATLPFKYLTDALGSEYGALSAVAGPACSAAFADVARQSPTLALPVLAYTPQALPPGGLALLAAGDAREAADAWGAFMAHMGWHRLALLSELATRSTLDVARLHADVVVHVELNPPDDDVDFDAILEWAQRVKQHGGRVLCVCVEDARVVRAALCAARGAGLVPAEGAVWLLPAHLPRGWLHPALGDVHNCTSAQLAEVAEGHFTVAAHWFVHWGAAVAEGAAAVATRARWHRRWQEACARILGVRNGADVGGEHCQYADAHAALLYDLLRLWASALRQLVAVHHAVIEDFHRPDLVRELLENAVKAEYLGLTGMFKWEEGQRARAGPLLLRQWANGTHAAVGEWAQGSLAVHKDAVRWATRDSHVPDDGTERCPLQPLADVMRADCRAAFIALASGLLALAVAALATAAWLYKRRAERHYRARLAALGLGLNPLALKAGGLDRWEVPRERVVINRKLGTGAFGTVYGGHALLAEDRGWTAVAVKTLKAGASTEEKLDFLSEAEAMKRFDHKNIVRLLGVVTKTEPVCTVMEFMLYGDLKNYLLARRHLAGATGAEREEVSAARLTAMALDAARALSYLAQLRYVHRDVAARNCLVSTNRVVKLADFGMTRLVFENDYYRFSRKGMLPVRWMAPESLALGVFSPASDVWSFGVLLYEIVTFGALPFQGLSNAEVLGRVKGGRTVQLPSGLKPQLEGLIKSCWRQDYRSRPTAAEVAAFLADWPRLLTPCPDVPLDALPLDSEGWRAPRDGERERAEARWVSWGAPASTATDTTYLSTDGAPTETDGFLPGSRGEPCP